MPYFTQTPHSFLPLPTIKDAYRKFEIDLGGLWGPGPLQAEGLQQGNRVWGSLSKTDPSTGRPRSHSLEGAGSLAKNSDECHDGEEMGLREEE